MPGLRWLSRPEHEGLTCLTFVRGARESAVLAAFGADRAHAAQVTGVTGQAPGSPGSPSVRVRRSGEWLIAAETDVPAYGVRPEVMRRVSAGTEAVSVRQDIGKLNHELVYAVGGQVVASVVTSVPRQWSGSDPERLASVMRDIETAGDDPGELEILLGAAERLASLSLDEDILDGPWLAAPVLPALADLPPPPPAGSPPAIGDPVIDLLLAHASPEDLIPVVRRRASRLLAMTGPGEHLAAAVQDALDGGHRPVSDDDPAGVELRKLAHDREQAELALSAGTDRPDATEAELRERIRRGEAAWVLRFVLAGRYRQALANELVLLQRSWHVAGWREQALADLAAVQVPAADREAAERTWQAIGDLPSPAATTDAGPVRLHVQRLIEGGMDLSRIAALSGLEPFWLDLILSGGIAEVSGYMASRLLSIRAPEP